MDYIATFECETCGHIREQKIEAPGVKAAFAQATKEAAEDEIVRGVVEREQ